MQVMFVVAAPTRAEQWKPRTHGLPISVLTHAPPAATFGAQTLLAKSSQ
jgi:hypothetical protein